MTYSDGDMQLRWHLLRYIRAERPFKVLTFDGRIQCRTERRDLFDDPFENREHVYDALRAFYAMGDQSTWKFARTRARIRIRSGSKFRLYSTGEKRLGSTQAINSSAFEPINHTLLPPPPLPPPHTPPQIQPTPSPPPPQSPAHFTLSNPS